jgi:phosphoserine phosphatase RsbU/P
MQISSVLIVDDNEGAAAALARGLEGRGYEVRTAANGAMALALLVERRFDLVLLDVVMPLIGGLEVLKLIRQSFSPATLPVIMTTANDETADIVQALGMGANDYVTKPLDFEVIVARMRTQLALKYSMQHVLELEGRLKARNADLESANAKLVRNAEERQKELETAARVQGALLPGLHPRMRGARFAWAFEPCQELAGDSLNIHFLDPEHVAFFVLDVSGHGVAASLLAVAATRILSANCADDSILINKSADGTCSEPASPVEVAGRLNQKFAWESGAGQYLTLFYALFNTRTRNLSYVCAGHPGAIRISRTSAPAILDGGGLPIGIGEGYEQRSVVLEPGDRIFLYSDGVTEAMNAARELLGRQGLTRILSAGSGAALDENVAQLVAYVKQWQDGALRDDVTVLAMECESP